MFQGYIPFETIEKSVSQLNRHNYLGAKIYRIETLLDSFSGFDRSVLPLFAFLIGKNFVENKNFKRFFGTFP